MDGDSLKPLAIRALRYEVGDRSLFDDADLEVLRGESVAIMGPSGCGKSTLLSLVLGLIRPDSGEITVAGRDVVKLSGDRLATLRAEHIGMVFQFGELIPELTPLENVALASQLAGKSGADVRGRAAALLEEFSVPRGTVTGTLSGGERQRVAVARALMNRPTLVLADEPTGALDKDSKKQVAESLFALPGAHDCAVVVVTHDPDVARRADRVLTIESGILVPLDRAVLK